MPLNAPADYYREGSHHGGMLHTFFFIYMGYARGGQVSDTVAASTEASWARSREARRGP